MTALAEIDLLDEASVLPPSTGPLRVLVRAGTTVLGTVDVNGDPSHADATRRLLVDRFAATLWARSRVQVPATDAGCGADELTVVVCSRDRPQLLRGCLEALARLTPASGHVLVVDNAPTTSETEGLCAELGVARIVEPVPGLDRARNRGWGAATTPLVAYVDDDARTHPDFARAVASAFMAREIVAVTGLVRPAELTTAAQVQFEAHGGMGKGDRRRLFHREAAPVGVQPHRIGVGTNMAFRRSVLAALGGFDDRLDVGTATRGGGDLDMLYRVVEAGHVVVYEPAAVVHHIHRRDEAGLLRQSYDNGVAYAACLQKWESATDGPKGAAAIGAARTRWHVSRHVRGPLGAMRRRDLVGLRLLLAEAKGSRHGRTALLAETRRITGRT